MPVFDAIRKGLYYDEIDQDLQKLYAEYKGGSSYLNAMFEVANAVYDLPADNKHYLLEVNPKPIPVEEQADHIRKVSDAIERYIYEDDKTALDNI